MNKSHRFKNIILRIFLIIALFSLQGVLFAQDIPVKYDSSFVNLRIPSGEYIDHFKTDRNFIFDQAQKPLQKWRLRFWYWLVRILARIFSNNGFAVFFRYFFFVLLLFFLIYKIADSRYHNIFSRSHQKIAVRLNEVQENINELDLDAEIEAFLQQKNFRSATRFLYLKLLKLLSQKSLIEWSPEKTNHDYVNELNGSHYQPLFKQLSFIYEYVWYGHFDPDNSQFEPINENFQNTFNQLDAR
jgi:hypothetical protein